MKTVGGAHDISSDSRVSHIHILPHCSYVTFRRFRTLSQSIKVGIALMTVVELCNFSEEYHICVHIEVCVVLGHWAQFCLCYNRSLEFINHTMFVT